MIKSQLIFLIISPYRELSYDWDNFVIKDTDTVLAFIAENSAIIPKLVKCNLRYIPTPLEDYGNGMLFLSKQIIEDNIKENISKYSIVLHSEEEYFLDQIALLNEKYNLSGLNVKEMLRFRDKFVMKNAITSKLKFFKIPAYTNDVTHISKLTFPVIVKPTNLAGAMHVSKIEDMVQLHKCLNNFPCDDYIIENFIEGDLIVCDILVYNKQIKQSMFSICDSVEKATKYYSYISVEILTDDTIIDKLTLVCRELITTLEIPNGMIHAEFIINQEDNYFIEVGIRPGGGPLYKIYEKTHNVNIYNLHFYAKYNLNNTPIFNTVMSNNYKYCICIYLLRTTDKAITDIFIPSIASLHEVTYYKDSWVNTKKNQLISR